jgi:hypothetical protein
MKKLKAIAFCVLLSIACIRLSAQTNIPLNEPDYNKPQIFSDLPQQMVLQTAEAERLFNLRAGDPVKAQLASQFLIIGTVVSNGGNKSNRTIIVKIPARNNAILTLTRVSTPEGVVRYTGRIMSRSNGDAYEIKNENSQFVFNKINLYDLINE